MKLPNIKTAVLERGPGADYQSIAIEHQAKQGLIAAAVGVAESYDDANASAQYLTAKNQSKRDLKVLHSKLDQTITNVKDLDVHYDKNETFEGPDGETYISTHTIAPKIWEKGVSDIKSKSSVKHPRARGEFNAYWNSVIEESRNVAEGQIEKGARDYFIDQKSKEVNQAIADKDYAGAVESLFFLKKEGFIDNDTHSAMLSNTKTAINEGIKADEIANYEGLLLQDATSNQDVENLYAAESQLRDKDTPSALTDKERDSLADSLEKKANENKLSLYAKEEKAKGQIVSDVELAINANDPRVTESTIQKLYDDELINSSKMTSMKNSYRKNQEDYHKKLAIDASIQAKILGGGMIDPKNKEERDAVNRLFENDVKAGADPWQAAIDTMKTYKIVPDRVGALMRGSNRADAPQLMQAAVLYNEASRNAPTSLKDINQGTELVRTVAANLSLGMSGPDATQTAIEWSQVDDTRKEAIKEVYKASAQTNAGALQDLVSDSAELDIPWSLFEAQTPLTMQIQFDGLVEQYITTTGGDIAAAQQKAFGDIRGQWSLTNINGDYSLMKNAPIGNVDSMKRSIKRDYGEGAVIRADALTEIQSNEGVNPSYHISRSGIEPQIETKSRKGSANYNSEWKESFKKNAGMDAEQVGIDSADDAQKYLDVLYSEGNVVSLGRWEWDSEAEQEKENKIAIKDAKESYAKRRTRTEKLESNKAKNRVRQFAAEKGLSPSEFLSSEKGQAMQEAQLKNIQLSGGLF